MAATRRPQAGKRWSKDAKELWAEVHDNFAIDTHHRVLLTQACELLTRAHDARAILAKDGLVIADRYGCPKPNPLIDVERNSVNTARLVLRELGLDFDGDADTSRTAPEERVRIHRTKGYA